jgi:hypothetical protein
MTAVMENIKINPTNKRKPSTLVIKYIQVKISPKVNTYSESKKKTLRFCGINFESKKLNLAILLFDSPGIEIIDQRDIVTAKIPNSATPTDLIVNGLLNKAKTAVPN